MPTFSRLVAALVLAALGAAVAQLLPPHFPEKTPLGMVAPVAAFMGLVVGWFFLGRRISRGSGAVVALGLTASISQTLLTLSAFGGKLMLDRALRKSFDNITEAVAGFFDATLEYGTIIAKPDVIVAIALGGVVAGAVTAWVARRTR